jgi:predicted phage tail component-like protein
MAKANNYLPSAAFKINGTFLENLVTGYHTLNASGKWTLPKELITAETSIRSGSIFMNSRYPAREIEIEYFLDGSGWDSLQTAYTSLMRYLDTENAEIIFNGEPDKYVKGYFVMGKDIEETVWTRHGTFTIVCMDPFKYSTTEYETTAVSNQFSVTYNGTYKAYPTFVTEFPASYDSDGDDTSTSQCGYVGFVDQREHVLQFGDPNETDWNDVTYPATVPVNKTFSSKNGWTQNNSQVHTGTQVGTISIGSSIDCIYPSSYGTGTGWHGPSLSTIITGETPPIGTNYNFTWKTNFKGTAAQFGGATVLLWHNDSGTRTLMSAVRFEKTTKDTNCRVFLYVGGTANKKYFTVACSKIGACAMKKIGNKVTFSVAGYTYTYASDNITDLVANEITFHFTQNKTQATMGTNNVPYCKLQRLSFNNYEDVANIFMPGDVLTVDTQDAGVYLDDGSATISATYLGALGNDWEDFVLVPGSNTIGVDYSDFTTSPPTFTIKYRERFL